ncbi:cation:proton antiporter [Flaviflagellibacter deserti]|uniref:Cation:proton antiporter n=1 Tax=Flaviflagellibacter deserti TaxID=2267266 RepID=A0ABV9YZ86_9HYPH
MLVPAVVLIVAGLLTMVSMVEPIAARLRVPTSVAFALLGIGIGVVSLVLQHYYAFDPNGVVQLIVNPPVASSVFIFVFLPILVFQSAVNIDVRQIAEDAGPVLVLSVVAVIVATFFIGGVVHWISGFSLMACLLLGAVVATTDPVAVIGIFRDIGAPSRLGRILEGEALFNDAAAITLFVLFLGYVLEPQPVNIGGTVTTFFLLGGGGAVFGYLVGRVVCVLTALVSDRPMAQVSLLLAAPYLAFIFAEHMLHVSGVVAVVSVGITFNLFGPAYASPVGWGQFHAIAEQLDYWATSLVFVLASVLIPKLLAGATWTDLGLLMVLVLAALVARAVILFVALPLMSRFGLSTAIGGRYGVVILWGGLRGALTLALALSITENPDVSLEVKRFIAVLATGFVLFTVLIQGTTLHILMRLVGLDRLSPLDEALRLQVLSVAQFNVQDQLAKSASLYELPEMQISGAMAEARERVEDFAGFDREHRISLGLVTLARQERELILEQFRERTISFSIVSDMLANSARLIDRARTGGEHGYAEAARKSLGLTTRLKLAHGIHRRLGVDTYFSRLLSDRFEIILASRIVLMQLTPFIHATIEPVLGTEVARRAQELLTERLEAIQRALDGLNLQFPEYSQALKRSFVLRTALRREELEYESLFEQSIIGPELHRDLKLRIAAQREKIDRRPPLDLGLDTCELVKRFPLFSSFNDEQVEEMRSLMTPVFALPGEMLIRKGDRGDAAYFISSGAVEVRAGFRQIRLGTGDVFGELALLTNEPRTADVFSIAYCSLLRLDARTFNSFIASHPDVGAHIESVAKKRLKENKVAAPQAAG